MQENTTLTNNKLEKKMPKYSFVISDTCISFQLWLSSDFLIKFLSCLVNSLIIHDIEVCTSLYAFGNTA